jgi:hypothetical protein
MSKPMRGMGAKMAGGNPNPARGRAPNDFYATPAPVTRALYRRYKDLLEGATVWEPCAGDGAMADTLLDSGVARVICTDLNPLPARRANPPYGRIMASDALTLRKLPAGLDAVVTNPPFNIAAEFIHHMLAVEGGPPPLLAVVLKSTFWHARSRADLFDKHPPTAVHPLRWRPDFKNLGAPTMEIMWTVWLKGDDFVTTYEPFDFPAGEA